MQRSFSNPPEHNQNLSSGYNLHKTDHYYHLNLTLEFVHNDSSWFSTLNGTLGYQYNKLAQNGFTENLDIFFLMENSLHLVTGCLIQTKDGKMTSIHFFAWLERKDLDESLLQQALFLAHTHSIFYLPVIVNLKNDRNPNYYKNDYLELLITTHYSQDLQSIWFVFREQETNSVRESTTIFHTQQDSTHNTLTSQVKIAIFLFFF